MNRDALTSELPAPFEAPCCCGRWTSVAVACRYVERASGPGVTLYACPECVLIVGVGPTVHDAIHNAPHLRAADRR